MAVRRDPKKSHRHGGAAKAACTKTCRPGGASDAEEPAKDGETEIVEDDDDEPDPIVGGVAGALIGGVAGLVIGGVLGAMADAFKSAVDDDDEDEELESEDEEEVSEEEPEGEESEDEAEVVDDDEEDSD